MKTTETMRSALALSAFLIMPACAGPSTDNASDAGASTQEQAAVDDARTVPAGRQLTFMLDETLSTADNRAGQTFDVHVVDPVVSSAGTVLIPAGAKGRGKIIEAHESSGAADPAALVVRLESVELDGAMVPMEGTVVSADVKASADDSGAETVGKIAVGAAAGAILGQILGKNTESTVAGAGVGAVAGTVVALTTRNGSATLPRGATVVIRLDKPLQSY